MLSVVLLKGEVMVTNWKPMLIGFGAGALVCAIGLTLAGFRYESEVEMRDRIACTIMRAISKPEPARTKPFVEMPKILAHATRDGIVVTASNDSTDKEIELLPNEDYVFVEYEGMSAPDQTGTIYGGGMELVRLGPRILAPGEAAEGIHVSPPGHRKAATIR